jgi:hypothetical protein
LSIGRLIRTRKTSDGWFEAHIGHSRTDYRVWLVGKGEVAASSGVDLDQVPLYPHPDKPYERVERE